MRFKRFYFKGLYSTFLIHQIAHGVYCKLSKNAESE